MVKNTIKASVGEFFVEILVTERHFLSFTLKQNEFVIPLRIFVGYMQLSKIPFSEKKATQYDLGDQSHKRAYKLQILKNDQL